MRRADLSPLDALVLAEIESLGQGHRARATATRTVSTRGPARNRPGGASGQAQARAARPGPAARGQGADDAPRGLSGEEAEGLFDEPFEISEPGDDPGQDGPTAADLLSPEEQAFVARAAGFLYGRPNADLILDRVWSQALESRPDGAYDPDAADPWTQPSPDAWTQGDGSDRGPGPPGVYSGAGASALPDADLRGPNGAPAAGPAPVPSELRPRSGAAPGTVRSGEGRRGHRPRPTPAPGPASSPAADTPPE
jgi:hypothetical protein